MAEQPTEDKGAPLVGSDGRDFDARLKKARKQAGLDQPKPDKPPPSLYGMAMRMSTELIAAVVVGAAIGFGIDKLLGTSPFGLLIFFALGMAAGFRNVFRTVREVEREDAKALKEAVAAGDKAPKDDDED